MVTDAEFKKLCDRMDELDAQFGMLLTTVEQLSTMLAEDIIEEIDEMLGDQPDVSPAMVEALRDLKRRASN